MHVESTKDQFIMHVKRTNPMGYTACSYTHLYRVSREGTMSCMKDQLYGKSTCKWSSCQKVYFYRGYVQQQYVQQYRGKTESTESSVNKISGCLHKYAQQQLVMIYVI